MDEILRRLESIERMVVELTIRVTPPSTPEGDWIDSAEFCRMVGLKDAKALSYRMAQGIFSPEVVRNVGTEKRPRYRFHRTKALQQFLNRTKVKVSR